MPPPAVCDDLISVGTKTLPGVRKRSGGGALYKWRRVPRRASSNTGTPNSVLAASRIGSIPGSASDRRDAPRRLLSKPVRGSLRPKRLAEHVGIHIPGAPFRIDSHHRFSPQIAGWGLADATKVSVEQNTSSPRPTPRRRSPRWMAAVPLFRTNGMPADSDSRRLLRTQETFAPAVETQFS